VNKGQLPKHYFNFIQTRQNMSLVAILPLGWFWHQQVQVGMYVYMYPQYMVNKVSRQLYSDACTVRASMWVFNKQWIWLVIIKSS